MNKIFANCSEEDIIYPAMAAEITEAQWPDATFKLLFKYNAAVDKWLKVKLIENTICVCKDGWLVIPKPLQMCAVMWYHHYLQYPGHTCLKETVSAALY